jgi:uncharacterized membrane protein YjfL (UPF0719 family)
MVSVLIAVLLFVAGIVQLLIALGIAVFGIYLGLNLVGRLTRGFSPVDELRSRNPAAGVLVLAVVIAMGIVIQGGIRGMTAGLGTSLDVVGIFTALARGFIAVIIGIIFAVIAIAVALYVMERILSGRNVAERAANVVTEKVSGQQLTRPLDMYAEIRSGNIAVGLAAAGILIAISVVIQAGVNGLSSALGLA